MLFARIALPALLGLFLFASIPLVTLSQEAQPENSPTLAERLPMEPMTFGTTFSSGAFIFGGGDSEGIMEDLLQEFRRRSRPGI